jgi:hypothetical protein
MPKFIDLTNQRFGRLLVIERVEKNKWGEYLWLCKCDCDNKITVRGNSLRNNHTTSCGCYGKEQRFNSVFKNLIGQRFERLLVIEMVEKPKNVKNRSVYWK